MNSASHEDSPDLSQNLGLPFPIIDGILPNNSTSVDLCAWLHQPIDYNMLFDNDILPLTSLLLDLNSHLTYTGHDLNGLDQEGMMLESYNRPSPQSCIYQVQAQLPMNPGLQVEDAASLISQGPVVQPQMPIYQFIQQCQLPASLQSQYQGSSLFMAQQAEIQVRGNVQIPSSHIQILDSNVQTPFQQQMREVQKKLPHFHQRAESSCSLEVYRDAKDLTVQGAADTSGASVKVSSLKRSSENENPVNAASSRKRSAISLKLKGEVLNYADQNPDAEVIDIANHFRICRTTVYGIMKKRSEILEFLNRPQASLVLDPYRLSESRFLILEELLTLWLKDLKLQWIQVSNKKIMTQAQEIYRMLSEPLQVPLHPCQFTSGWLKRFQKRKNINSRGTHGKIGSRPPSAEGRNHFASSRVRRYKKCDIYSCETTSMHLNFVAPNFLQEKSQDKATGKSDLLSASIVTCFNATGSDKREPLVLVRQGEPLALKAIGHHEMVDDAETEDLKKDTLIRWLMEFDRTLVHPILLFVDETIWRLLSFDCEDSGSYLRLIDVIKVPERHAGSTPMGAGIAKEFKSSYYWHLISALIHRTESLGGNGNNSKKLDTLEEHLGLIQAAWDKIHSRDIKRLFRKFLEPIGPAADGFASKSQYIQPFYYSTMLPVHIKDSFPEVSDAVIQYFANLDKDTGPSSFMRSTIQQISHHPEFFRYFKHGGVNIVRVAKLRPKPKSSINILDLLKNSKAAVLGTNSDCELRSFRLTMRTRDRRSNNDDEKSKHANKLPTCLARRRRV